MQTTILNLMKMEESSPKGSKTLWEKEKLLVIVFPGDLFCRHVKTLKGLVWETVKELLIDTCQPGHSPVRLTLVKLLQLVSIPCQ